MHAIRKLTRAQYEAILWVLEYHLANNDTPSESLVIGTQKIRDAVRAYDNLAEEKRKMKRARIETAAYAGKAATVELRTEDRRVRR